MRTLEHACNTVRGLERGKLTGGAGSLSVQTQFSGAGEGLFEPPPCAADVADPGLGRRKIDRSGDFSDTVAGFVGLGQHPSPSRESRVHLAGGIFDFGEVELRLDREPAHVPPPRVPGHFFKSVGSLAEASFEGRNIGEVGVGQQAPQRARLEVAARPAPQRSGAGHPVGGILGAGEVGKGRGRSSSIAPLAEVAVQFFGQSPRTTQFELLAVQIHQQESRAVGETPAVGAVESPCGIEENGLCGTRISCKVHGHTRRPTSAPGHDGVLVLRTGHLRAPPPGRAGPRTRHAFGVLHQVLAGADRALIGKGTKNFRRQRLIFRRRHHFLRG